MIIQFILIAIYSLVDRVLFGWLNLPLLDPSIVNGVQGFINTLTSPIGVISYLYTPPVFLVVIGMILAVLTFEWIYYGIMWFIKKLPIGAK